MLKNKLSDNLKISVVPTSKIDINQIYELEKYIFAKNECISKSRLRYFLSSPYATFFMLYDNISAVGYGIALRNKLRNGQYKGRIYSIGVIPEYKSKGAGSFLLAAMEKHLIKSGVSYIVLETLQGRDGAKLFFLKHGYTESKFLPNYYPYGDGVRMKKVVAEKSKPGEFI
ncbi:MAG TPA: N-acetyltransferase [Syntrophales bacterium]|nr:N-acetyltransferase [Syntrophales bacterium]